MTSFKLFVPQARIDDWMSAGSVDFDTKALGPTDGSARLEGEAAVWFQREDTDTGDPHGLIGKVKTAAQLEALGAEHMSNSVIIGDTAYVVVEGFAGTAPSAESLELAAPQAAAPRVVPKDGPKAAPQPAPQPAPQAAAPRPPAQRKKAGNEEKNPKDGVDVDELARLLIEKL